MATFFTLSEIKARKEPKMYMIVTGAVHEIIRLTRNIYYNSFVLFFLLGKCTHLYPENITVLSGYIWEM